MTYSSIKKIILSFFVCFCFSSSFAIADVTSEAIYCGKTVRALIRNYDILHLSQNLKNGVFFGKVCGNISSFTADINDFRSNCCSPDFLSALGPLGADFSGACTEIENFIGPNSNDIPLDLGLGYLCGTRAGTCEGNLTNEQYSACHCGRELKPLLANMGALSGLLSTIENGGNLNPQICYAFPKAFNGCSCCNSGLPAAVKGAFPAFKNEISMLTNLCSQVKNNGLLLIFAWALSCNNAYPTQYLYPTHCSN